MKKNIIRVLSLLLVAVFLFCGCSGAGTPVPQETTAILPTVQAQETTAIAETTLPQETEAATEPITEPAPTESQEVLPETEETVSEDGEYSSKDEVALYLHLFGHLPSNYITKKQAQNLGWVSKDGNLWKVAPGKSIGGDHFGNYEHLLPEGHKYYECDIDFPGDYRNGKRIIFSEDGLIYYTEDHYASFELLYGEE